jgi:hypothetical protein
MKKFISLIGFLCFFIAESIAGVSISQFAIRSGYASGDKLVANAGQPTTFIVDATLVHAGTTYNMARVTVVYQENNVDTELSEELWKSDWSTGSGIWQPVINATLPAGKTAGRIYLKLQTWEGSNQGPTNYSNISYGIQVSGTNPGGGTGGDVVIGTPPAFTPPVSGAVPIYEYVKGNRRMLTTTYYSSFIGFAYNGIFGFGFPTPTPGTVPLYEYYRFASGNSFYTINQGIPWGYNDDGIVCYVYPNQVAKTLPVYQHYMGDANGGYHFYTNYPGVHENYEFQDVQFYLLQNKQPTTNPLPDDDYAEVYCYWNPTINDHYYTTVKKDYGGYTYEFVLGYVSRAQRPGMVPLYSYYKSADNHFYTVQKQDYWSYLYEGIVGYVHTTAESGTVGVYSYYNDYSVDHYYKTSNTTIPGYNNEGIKFYMLQYNH